MAEGAADLEQGEIGRLQSRRGFVDHLRQQDPLDIPFDQNGGIGEEEVAVRQLQIAFEKAAFGGIGAVIEERQVEDVRGGDDFGAAAAEIADRAEAALVENVSAVGRDHDLVSVMGAVVAFELQDAHHLADEDLLQLGVEMRFGLLDEDQVDRWAIVLDCQPLLVEIEQLNHHEDQVLETETVVAIGQGQRFGLIAFLWLTGAHWDGGGFM